MRVFRHALYLFFLGAAIACASTPAIWIDNVNGSSPASGSPEDFGPATALATCHTNGSASTTIQWPSHGLGGLIPTDGSAVLFLNTASGRQYSEIVDIPDENTLLVEDSFNIAMGSAVDCAVGGRLLNASVQLVADMKANHGSPVHGNNQGGWELHFVDTGVAYVWSATRNASGATGVGAGFYGEKNPDRPVIECNFQPGTCLSAAGADVRGLEFHNTNPTKTGTLGIVRPENGKILDCIIGGEDSSDGWETGVQMTTTPTAVLSSWIRNNETGIATTSATNVDEGALVVGNVIEGNTTGVSAAGQVSMLLNVVWANETGFESTISSVGPSTLLLLNTIVSNTVGVDLTTRAAIHNLLFASNLITNNGTGATYSSATAMDIERESALVDFNCYGQGPAANSSDVSSFPKGSNTIAVNPAYRDAASGDFAPTAVLPTFVAWPPGLDGLTPRTFPGTLTATQLQCGAIQLGSGGAYNNVGL